MKYTAVISVKMDIEVETDTPEEAKLEAHDRALTYLSELTGYEDFEGATIGKIEIAKVQ